MTAGINTAADATRRPRFVQSNRLAGGKDVIGSDGTISAVTLGKLLERSFQVRLSIVRPKDILKHQFGVCGFPKKKIGQPVFS